jgi:hypothetical protein
MNEGDKESLRQAAGSPETATMTVLEVIGEPGGPGTSCAERMSAEEMATLREIASSLRSANTRLWTLADGDYKRPGVFP